MIRYKCVYIIHTLSASNIIVHTTFYLLFSYAHVQITDNPPLENIFNYKKNLERQVNIL